MSSRKEVLVPPAVSRDISVNYKEVWRAGGKRGSETGNPYDVQLGAFWLGDENGGVSELLPTLPEKVEAIARSGEVFRMLDVGSASYARFLTGYEPTDWTEVQKGNVIYSYPLGFKVGSDSINHFLIKSGFVPGKHFELIAVNGGSFAIPEKPGLKLVMANIYNGIEEVTPDSIHVITSFRTVYQEFGGFYILEYFDKLLKKSDDPDKNGLAVVWPFRQPITLLVDPQGNEIRISTVMNMVGVHYWDKGEHASWKKGKQDLSFPVYASEYLKFKEMSPILVYSIQGDAFDSYLSGGGNIAYVQNSRLGLLRERATETHRFVTSK